MKRLTESELSVGRVKLRTVYIGLGSNLGNKVLAIEAAIEKIKKLENSRFITMSGLYETSPIEVEGGSFLNAVAMIETGSEPMTLLETLLCIETSIGRTRKPGKKGSRLIDLDLLLHGNSVIEEKDLILPHPRMLHRRFVMEPLAELAPDLKIPPTGITASAVAANLVKSHPEQEIKHLGTLEEAKESLKFEV